MTQAQTALRWVAKFLIGFAGPVILVIALGFLAQVIVNH
jgi:hypothetical protein